MEAIITELLLVATFIAFFVSALVEVIKRAVPKLPVQYLPLIAMLMGLVVGYLAYISFDLGVPFAHMLWGGAIAGLASVGFFEGVIKPLALRTK